MTLRVPVWALKFEKQPFFVILTIFQSPSRGPKHQAILFFSSS